MNARSEMELHYFGLLNLARHFSSPMSERAVGGRRLCPAWVNVLSVSAMPGFPSWGTYGAAMSAARSLSQHLRVRSRKAGLRVVNVYPGPLDERHSEQYQLPRLGAVPFARTILQALQEGVEEVFPGEVAQEWARQELPSEGVGAMSHPRTPR
jgi:NAD(P)-dependent dehydrogenase (short-subunit alcohol dehydrogenase family)